jgi:hypothetical protein
MIVLMAPAVFDHWLFHEVINRSLNATILLEMLFEVVVDVSTAVTVRQQI